MKGVFETKIASSSKMRLLKRKVGYEADELVGSKQGKTARVMEGDEDMS